MSGPPESGWAQPVINGRKLRKAHWFEVRRNPGLPVVWIERRSLCGRWWHYCEVAATADPSLQCAVCRRRLEADGAERNA